MGLFDKKNKGLFGGLFDFNGDGKTSWAEQFIAFKIFEECTKKDSSTADHYLNNDLVDFGSDTFNKYKWRILCEDGSKFGIDPEDYESEYEYNEALEEAKFSWRYNCEDGLKFGIIPENYETEYEYNEAIEDVKYGWRDTCEDGFEFGIFPEDYETEYEYNEAFEEAKYGWRDTCDDGFDVDIDPEDYETEEEYNEELEEARSNANVIINPFSVQVEFPAFDKLEEVRETDLPNKRRYNAAYSLANEFAYYSNNEYEKREMSRYQFILEKANTVVAANYLTHDGDFLYSQAVKDNFKLPVTLPDEDETREFGFLEILQKIERKDISLCLEIWSWCLNQFLPYTEYDLFSKATLTNDVLDDLYSFSTEFKTSLINYMSEHPDFRIKVVREAEDLANNLAELVVNTIKQNLSDTAKALFEDGLAIADGKWKLIIKLTDGVIHSSMNYEELETIEYIEQELLPLIKSYQDGMILDGIEVWEKDITEYKLRVEQCCAQYAYTRSNSWRQTIPDGKEYGLDPCNYKSEKEYLEDLNEEKYSWRRRFKNCDTCGLTPIDYENENDFLDVLSLRMNERRKKEHEEHEERYKKELERENVPPIPDDNIYIYCGVALPFSPRPYSFRTNDTTIKIGDIVIVPIGEEQRETKGTVVSVGQYTRIGVPFPVERTKFILRKT